MNLYLSAHSVMTHGYGDIGGTETACYREAFWKLPYILVSVTDSLCMIIHLRVTANHIWSANEGGVKRKHAHLGLVLFAKPGYTVLS